MSPSNYSGVGELFDGDTSVGKYHCNISVRRNFGVDRTGERYEKLPSLNGTMTLGNDWHKFFNEQGKQYVLVLANGEKYRVFFADLGQEARMAINPFEQ